MKRKWEQEPTVYLPWTFGALKIHYIQSSIIAFKKSDIDCELYTFVSSCAIGLLRCR